MRTLIYKRTHPGDPDPEGRFGIHGCMGQVRTWGFEAVIGIGGMGAEPRSHGLSGKVNWIEVGPRKRAGADTRGPVVTFEHFLLFGSIGPSFLDLLPLQAGKDLPLPALLDPLDPDWRDVDRHPILVPRAEESVRVRMGGAALAAVLMYREHALGTSRGAAEGLLDGVA